MTGLPILYSFRRCPYAMRARMALFVSGAPFEIREVVLRNKPAAMLAASPKATVPVLHLADGTVIDESIDIMRRTLRHNDPEQWLAGDDAGLIAANDTIFKHHLDRYKYPERHASDALAHRAAGTEWLDKLERRLAQADFLTGQARGLTDIAIFPFVRQFAAVDADWFAALPLPLVRAWLDQNLQSALFARAMVRLPAWQDGDLPTIWCGQAPAV